MVLYGGQYYIQSTVRILKMLRQSPIIQAAEQVIAQQMVEWMIGLVSVG